MTGVELRQPAKFVSRYVARDLDQFEHWRACGTRRSMAGHLAVPAPSRDQYLISFCAPAP